MKKKLISFIKKWLSNIYEKDMKKMILMEDFGNLTEKDIEELKKLVKR